MMGLIRSNISIDIAAPRGEELYSVARADALAQGSGGFVAAIGEHPPG
jgi:hypothetical protein